MKRILFLILLLVVLAGPAFAAAPTATSFSSTASTVGATLLQLQGADADNTALVYAIASGPSHGTLSGLITATGYVVYTPTTSYTGADSFTYTVTSGGDTTAAATVTLTVTNAKTRIVDTIVDSGGTARSGVVTFILTQKVYSPAGLIPVSSTVSATLSSGSFDVSLYPSTALSPQAYYQMWFTATGSLRRELIGVYAIPASSATSILLEPYRVTDTNLAAQYTFMSTAAINSLTTGLGGAVTAFNGRVGSVTPATNDYTWAQIDKTTSSLANITTRSASDLSSGTLPDARFPATLPAASGVNLTALNATNLASGTVSPARLGSLTDTALPYKTSSALADSPLLRYGADSIGLAAGTVASAGSSQTSARFVLYPGASSQYLGIGVDSSKFWFNNATSSAFYLYWGGEFGERWHFVPSGQQIETATNTFTYDFQTSGTTTTGALIFLTNTDTIRLTPRGGAGWDIVDTLTAKKLISNATNPDLGDSTHPFRDVHLRNGKFYGSTSGTTTVVATAAAGTTTVTLPAATDTLVGKATTDTLTNKTVDAEGTGNSITIPIKVFLAAAGCNNATAGSFWDIPASTAAVAACVTGTNIQKGVLDFADSGPFVAQNTLVLPADFSGAIDARILWTTTATSGNAKWSLATICTDVAASATDDPSFNTASTVTTAAPGTASRVQTSSITGVTATGCSAGNLLHVKISRDGTDGSDTIGATARLIGVEITIRRAM